MQGSRSLGDQILSEADIQLMQAPSQSDKVVAVISRAFGRDRFAEGAQVGQRKARLRGLSKTKF